MRRHPMKRIWTGLFIVSSIFSFGCQGAVIEPDSVGADPGTAGKRSRPQGSGGSPNDGGAGPSRGGASTSIPWSGVSGAGNPGPTPAAVPHAFTRLTRAEYAATVLSAFGVEADLSIIPGDGRVGSFTSNAGPTPDPVHPYILAAEELARAVVPSQLPACDGGRAAACVETSYRLPLARLYRRPLAAGEVTALANLIASLTEQGVSADEATRAMVSTALLSPDFLFHSAAAGVDAPAEARRLAERLSYAIWDAPPDDALDAAVAGPDGGLATRLRQQALRLASDARAVPVLARFLAQWLHLDLDLRLENASFAASPRYLELIAFVENALRENASVTSFVAGQRGFVHRDNLAAYGLDAESSSAAEEMSAVTWTGDSPRRGLLGQELIVDSTRHPDKSRRWIFRGRLIRSSLLCDVIPAPSAEVVAAAGEVSDRTTDARCSSCHRLMDPIGKAFASLDADNAGTPPAAEVLSHSELAGTYADLPALLEAVAASRSFAECFAKHWLSFFLEQPLTSADPVVVTQIADAVQAGATLRDVVEGTVVNLEASSGAVEPMCKGL